MAQVPASEVNERRKEHEPLLMHLMNNWAIVLPLLKVATAKLDAKNDTLIMDCRTARGVGVNTLDPRVIFEGARPVEYTAIRKMLSSHPFLYSSRWCKAFSMEVKQHMKSKKGTAGVFCIFAIGDSTEHAPEGSAPLPDFTMNVALYNETDLDNIAGANLTPAQVAEAQRRATEQEDVRVDAQPS